MVVAAVLLVLGGAGSLQADTVAEWKFDGTSDVGADGVITLDNATPGASRKSVVQGSTQFEAKATGLSTNWAAFLQSGYLNVLPGNGDANKNKPGLVTKNDPADTKNAEFRRYFGYAGLGPEKAGAVCLVVSPQDDWTESKRRGLFSTGHLIEGAISLAIQKSGQLVLRLGGKKTKYVEVSLGHKWEPGKWYFIGASWDGEKKPLLVVYDLTDDPKASAEKADTAEGAEPAPACDQPRFDPLVVGATWYNTGGESFTNDGADARIAYVRVDNGFADQAAFKAILTSLAAAPAPAPSH